ncbi:MAG: 30S ribosomal protein S18 [Alphaproteobacteria bacterium]|nr:30S ribosomal protein S18 [Alphaproteobacteria bacterium]
MLAATKKPSRGSRRVIDYKDPRALSFFLTDGGKILPRRVSNLEPREQKKLKIAIKRARILAFLPFVQKAEER